jgi:hypothetical protein
MKTVVAYLSGVPSSHKNPHKIEALKRFVQGVSSLGDNGIAHSGSNIIHADVGVIQGWVHEGSPNSSHLKIRKTVAENKFNKHTIIIDSNLFNYKDKDHPTRYLRYSMDGVFPTTGNYFWDEIDPRRWLQISQQLGLTLKDWRTQGNHILICTQRNGGWSMKGFPVTSWLDKVVLEIKKYSDRPIIVRGHPGDKQASRYLRDKPGYYTISKNPSILDDLKNSWAMVNYNSTPAVAASIEGIPAFITDPEPRTSQAYDVANLDLSRIESPELKDRQKWIEKISMCHWNFKELTTGECWIHLRKFI